MHYAKFYVAILGVLITVGAQLLAKHTGIDLGPYAPELINAIGGLLTAEAVRQVPNAPADQP